MFALKAAVLVFGLCLLDLAFGAHRSIAPEKGTKSARLGSDQPKEHPAGCFNYNSDIIGNDLNNGLNDKVDSATECVNLCLSKYPTALYFTWSDDTIPDPNYRRTCWCTPDNQGSSPSFGTTSGPLTCGGNDPNTCCDSVLMTSQAEIASSVQSHVLGYYTKHSVGTNGRWNYVQQGGQGHYLYYIDSLQLWFIGDVIGSATGYASNPGLARCLEDVHKIWDYWSPSAGQWLLDYSARTDCTEEVGPPPGNDYCVTNAACSGCALTLPGLDGNLYCCNNQCNWGWIDIDVNQVCTCGHS